MSNACPFRHHNLRLQNNPLSVNLPFSSFFALIYNFSCSWPKWPYFLIIWRKNWKRHRNVSSSSMGLCSLFPTHHNGIQKIPINVPCICPTVPLITPWFVPCCSAFFPITAHLPSYQHLTCLPSLQWAPAVLGTMLVAGSMLNRIDESCSDEGAGRKSSILTSCVGQGSTEREQLGRGNSDIQWCPLLFPSSC